MKQLRSYQREAIDSLLQYWEHKSGNPIICIPTGGGKALVIATFIKECIQAFPKTRFMMLTHVKELLEQNYMELLNEWREAPVGLYSAGLNKRQHTSQVTIAGIQSVYKKASIFGWQDIIIIDESHLLGEKDDGMYRKFIADLKQLNSAIKVVGLTATPYRLKQGLLTDGDNALFDDIVYDISIGQLIKEGYLCKLISKSSKNKVDLTSVSITNGDFNLGQMEKSFDNDNIIDSMLNEVYDLAGSRNKRLFFSSGIQHAHHIRDKIRLRGMDCEVVHGDMDDKDRKSILHRFKSNQLRDLVNYGVLTTGYNDPSLDCIVLARGTKSTGLYVQILGRGTRTYAGKENCLILDYGGNIDRHGPIDQIKIKPKRNSDGKGEVQKAPVKICPKCDSANNIAALSCEDCGHEFPEVIKHDAVASSAPVMGEAVKPIEFEVDRWTMLRHQKEGKPDSVKIKYYSGFNYIQEWITIEHGGFATQKARIKLAKLLHDQRLLYKLNKTDDILNNQANFRMPKKIKYKKNGKYEEVVEYVF